MRRWSRRTRDRNWSRQRWLPKTCGRTVHRLRSTKSRKHFRDTTKTPTAMNRTGHKNNATSKGKRVAHLIRGPQRRVLKSVDREETRMSKKLARTRNQMAAMWIGTMIQSRVRTDLIRVKIGTPPQRHHVLTRKRFKGFCFYQRIFSSVSFPGRHIFFAGKKNLFFDSSNYTRYV